MAIDQSLSCTAYTIYYDDKKVIVDKGVIRTGSTDAKTKYDPDVVEYCDTVMERVFHIASHLSYISREYGVNKWVLESLSYGSVGNATRDLAILYGAITFCLMREVGAIADDIVSYAPTTLKAYARTLLPEAEQTELNGKGKPIKVKMNKKMMVKAVEGVVGQDYFGDYRMSGKNAGLNDLADSWVLLQLYLKDL